MVSDLIFSWLMDLILNPSLIILRAKLASSAILHMLKQLFCTTENSNYSIPIIIIKLIKVFQTTDGTE